MRQYWQKWHGNDRRICKSEGGFTLVELLIVMVIIAALAGGAIPLVSKRAEQARHTRAVSDIENLSSAVDYYETDMGAYPDSLDALFTAPTDETQAADWQGPYLKRRIANDPWGQPYNYVVPGSHNTGSYDLSSYGRDKQEGGTGPDADIVNWDETAGS